MCYSPDMDDFAMTYGHFNNNNDNNRYFVLETWDITVHLITYIVIQLHKIIIVDSHKVQTIHNSMHSSLQNQK